MEERIIKLGLNFDESLGKNDYISFSGQQKSKLSQTIDSLKSIFKIDIKNVSSNSDTKNQVVKFHINSKEPKAVEVLLGRMFSTEFDIADEFNIAAEK